MDDLSLVWSVASKSCVVLLELRLRFGLELPDDSREFGLRLAFCLYSCVFQTVALSLFILVYPSVFSSCICGFLLWCSAFGFNSE